VAANGLSEEAARLEEERATALVEAERLEVRLQDAAGPERVREAARRDLGMKDPSGEVLREYEVEDRGSGEQGGGGGDG
jgi:cell division protein FtsL